MLKVKFLLDEEWKVIKNYPGYAVSNWGKVRRITKGRHTFIGRNLKLFYRCGYLAINLHNSEGQKNT